MEKKNIFIIVLMFVMTVCFAPSAFAQIDMNAIQPDIDEIHTLIRDIYKTETVNQILIDSMGKIMDLQDVDKWLLLSIKDKNFKKAESLIQNGADINTSVKFAPIFNLENDMDAVKFFVEQGANLNTKTADDFESTLLMLTDDIEIAAYLLNNGASLHIEDKYGKTALERACNALNPEKVQFLLNSGIKVFDMEKLSLYLYNTIAFNIVPPHHTHDNLLKVVKILLDNDAIYRDYYFVKHINLLINLTSEYEQDELFELVYKAKHDYFMKCLSNIPKVYDKNDIYIQTVKLLLEQGIDPYYKNDKGETPLSLAKKKGNKQICNLLIEYGALE